MRSHAREQLQRGPNGVSNGGLQHRDRQSLKQLPYAGAKFAALDFLDLEPKFGCIWMAYVAPIMPFRASKEHAFVQNAGSLPFDSAGRETSAMLLKVHGINAKSFVNGEVVWWLLREGVRGRTVHSQVVLRLWLSHSVGTESGAG